MPSSSLPPPPSPLHAAARLGLELAASAPHLRLRDVALLVAGRRTRPPTADPVPPGLVALCASALLASPRLSVHFGFLICTDDAEDSWAEDPPPPGHHDRIGILVPVENILRGVVEGLPRSLRRRVRVAPGSDVLSELVQSCSAASAGES